MTPLVSLDPGIRGCGLALFQGGELHGAWYVRNPTPKGNAPDAVQSMAGALALLINARAGGELILVVEWPQIYTFGKGKGDPNDLLPLVGVSMALMGLLHASPSRVFLETFRYLPREWKGTIDPEEICRRVRRRLTPFEFSMVDLPSSTCEPCLDRTSVRDCSKSTCLAHNVYDAIGIGLKHIGRFDAQRVIAR